MLSVRTHSSPLKGVFVDVANACRLVGERTTDETVVAVVLVGDIAMTFLLGHLGTEEIAIAVVVAVDEVGILELAILRKVHELVFAEGILGDDLLDGTVETHADGILIIGTHGQVEHTDVARAVVVRYDRHLDAGEVVHIDPCTVAFDEGAMVLLELIEEVLQILVEHLVGAVRSYRDVGRGEQMARGRDADEQLGTDAVELATEIVVLLVVGLSPLRPVGSLQLDAHAVEGAFEGHALQQGTARLGLCPEATDEQEK